MASREDLYAKFGIAAEAAQLLETELGTMILCLRGLENGWHIIPDAEAGRIELEEIDSSTLGRLLKNLKGRVELKDDLEPRFSSALAARNRLIHGFYERHNFKIQTEIGRDEMIADLDLLHNELFEAWQIASAMTSMISDFILASKPQKSQGVP